MQGSGVPISLEFDNNIAKPLDSKCLVADITARNALNFKYPGLICHVLSDDKLYRCKNDLSWVEVGTGTSGVISYEEEITISNTATLLYPIDHTLGTRSLVTSISRNYGDYQELDLKPTKPTTNQIVYDLAGYDLSIGQKYLITVIKK